MKQVNNAADTLRVPTPHTECAGYMGTQRMRFQDPLRSASSGGAAAAAASAATLKVGPQQRLRQALPGIQAAKDGDVIEIDAGRLRRRRCHDPGQPAYDPRRRQRPRQAPRQRPHAGGKAIWVIAGSDITIENIEFSGARVRDRNGAGIRPEGRNLTVRNCRFYDCENGILGGNGEMLIEHCEFDHCGPVANPATHSLYIGERCTRLTSVSTTRPT